MLALAKRQRPGDPEMLLTKGHLLLAVFIWYASSRSNRPAELYTVGLYE